jgi:hypothetical protein
MKLFLRVSILRALTALPVLCLLSLFTLALPGAVAANPACGTLLETADGLTTLDGDLNCPDTGPGAALYIIGSAGLDMNGFTITCGDSEDDVTEVLMDGVHLLGTKNSLSNGAIFNCQDGVVIDALASGARVTMVHVVKNWDDGFNINGDGNKFSQVTAWENRDEGIDLQLNADKNQILNSIAYANDGKGVSIDGVKNKLKFVTSYDNGDDGFYIGGANNSLSNVSSVNNPVAFDIQGFGNKIKSSHVVGSSDVIPEPFRLGVSIRGEKGKLTGVVVLAVDGDGVLVENCAPPRRCDDGEIARGNKLSQLFVVQSGGYGINMLESAGNTVQGSAAVLSTLDDAQDLQIPPTMPPVCGNRWKDNHFGTSFPAACIGSGVEEPEAR